MTLTIEITEGGSDAEKLRTALRWLRATSEAMENDSGLADAILAVGRFAVQDKSDPTWPKIGEVVVER